ncbi:MAG: maleylpyruvate isomerase family mycothiol-dependent enzyme [Actinobacteria bacterium]|nr:maleylpyruvate isomerase family mycothiol-dependent enzyme [Actinomycetota bacterium]
MQPTQVYDGILTALAEQDEELDGLVADLDEAGWALPSRCPGWTISDVLLHVAQTDEAAAASAEGHPVDAATVFGRPAEAWTGANVDDLAGQAVAAQRGQPGKDVHERWRAASAAQLKAFRACDSGDRLPWVVGRMAAVTLATTRLAEGWIHTGDVAAGLGRELAPTARLQPIARLAWRTLPYAFSRAGRTLSGPVALSLTAPDGTTWEFTSDEPAATTVTGPALDFCLVAARRADPSDTALSATGPDGDAVLELVRTFA